LLDAVLIGLNLTLAMSRAHPAFNHSFTLVLAALTQESILTSTCSLATSNHAGAVARAHEALCVDWALEFTSLTSTRVSTLATCKSKLVDGTLAKSRADQPLISGRAWKLALCAEESSVATTDSVVTSFVELAGTVTIARRASAVLNTRAHDLAQLAFPLLLALTCGSIIWRQPTGSSLIT